MLLSLNHTAIYKQTQEYIVTHINKYTNNKTLRSTNELTVNVPYFTQTALLLSALTLLNYNKNKTPILLKRNSFLTTQRWFLLI